MQQSRQVQSDLQLLEVYFWSLQSEVEAKLRELTAFRENVKHLVLSCAPEGRDEQLRAIEKLMEQIDRMLCTNKVVCQTLVEMLETTKTLARDLHDEGI